jgi:hypothetical protein
MGCAVTLMELLRLAEEEKNDHPLKYKSCVMSNPFFDFYDKKI